MDDYHVRLIQAVIKHTREPLLLSEWLKGTMLVKFFKGLEGGYYAGSRLLYTDAGISVDLDPAAVTGVMFENIVTAENADEVIHDLERDLNLAKELWTDLKNQQKIMVKEHEVERDVFKIKNDELTAIIVDADKTLQFQEQLLKSKDAAIVEQDDKIIVLQNQLEEFLSGAEARIDMIQEEIDKVPDDLKADPS